MSAKTNQDNSRANQAIDTFRRQLRQTHLIALTRAALGLVLGGGLGYALDLVLDKKFFYTIIGLVLGFVLMNIITIATTRKMINRERTRSHAR